MRRTFLMGLLGGVAALFVTGEAAARPHGPPRRRVRRRVRRRMRRMRRRGRWFMRAGRRALIVPVGIGIGWELMVDNRVALVQSMQGEQLVVRYSDNGAVETVPMVQENTPDNGEVLPGSEYEGEVEEEFDE